jgi:hypothetical protein
VIDPAGAPQPVGYLMLAYAAFGYLELLFLLLALLVLPLLLDSCYELGCYLLLLLGCCFLLSYTGSWLHLQAGLAL